MIQSEFPEKSKIGRVNPVHKSGPSDNIDNYRPISVLSIFSKIFEKLTYTRMLSFISRFDILSSCQFGFRKGRSTTQAITKLLSASMVDRVEFRAVIPMVASSILLGSIDVLVELISGDRN